MLSTRTCSKVFNVGRIDGGCVVGLVDENESKVVSYGKMDNGTDRQVDGDTLFEIGSVTKTFTALLLADMVEHGQMKLNDPLANYLPAEVKVPSRTPSKSPCFNLRRIPQDCRVSRPISIQRFQIILVRATRSKNSMLFYQTAR